MNHQTSPTPQAPASGPDQTRLALIRAAMVLFARNGYEATTTREIASTAKANIGSIAYHFGGKEGLHAACAQHIVDTIRSINAEAMDGAEVPADMPPDMAVAILENLIARIVGFIVARPEGGEIVQFILRELNRATAALNTIYYGVFEPTHKRLCAIWAIASGSDRDAESTMLTIFALVGQLVYFRIGREAVSRRMGWKAVGPEEAAAIVEVAQFNLRAILEARRKER